MKPTKTSRRARTRDPFESEIESAPRPGEFISYGKSFSFVRALEELAKRIDPLIEDDPERAAGVYETFLAGCYAKTDEYDDSSGGFGNFSARRVGTSTRRSACISRPERRSAWPNESSGPTTRTWMR